MNIAPRIDRRLFLASATAAGGALVLGFDVRTRARANDAAEINAWIVINADDSVVIRVARSEMGQGVSTVLPMLVAEELGCDWSKVRVEFPSPAENLRRGRAWGDFSTGGSRSVRNSQAALRRAGAAARELLIAAAAQRWNVAATDCRAANGVITHPASGRSIAFGQVAAAAAAIAPPKDIALKHPKDWTLCGKPVPRVDVADKVQGKPLYGIDVRLPGMLYASLRRCPVFKGKLRSVGEARIVGMKGIRKVVTFPDAVAVVGDTWWQANNALNALAVVWDDAGNGKVSSDTIHDFLQSGLVASDAGVGRRQGDLADGFARSTKRIEADYSVPFLAHATLEPQNCTAHVTGDTAEIWVPTQNGEASLASAANALDIPARNIRLHKTLLGGGFGRRGAVQDFVPHAALIARQMGRPVQTIWSREEDMRHDYYRPVAMARMAAGLDTAGMPLAWHVRLAGNSILGTLMPQAIGKVDRNFQEGFLADMPYDVPGYLADYAMRNTHVPVGFWRCVNHTQNCFYRESFIDEMAHAAGADPLDYRHRLLGKHRHAARLRAVLDAVAKRAGWGTVAPDGVHRGIALNVSHGTFVAAVAEATVSGGGARMRRVVMAIDPGIVVNPLTVEEQVESGVVFGLTAALYGEVTVKDGRVEQSNFNDYRMLRMAEMPKVETIVMAGGGGFGGVGEPPVAVVAPALCNAVFAATGKRIRSLPLKNHDLTRT